MAGGAMFPIWELGRSNFTESNCNRYGHQGAAIVTENGISIGGHQTVGTVSTSLWGLPADRVDKAD